MKKLTAILLMLALLTGVLAGCKSKAPSGEVAPAPSATEAPAPSATEAPAPSATEAPVEDSAPFSLGTLVDGVYTNTYVGVGCNLDESWTYYSAEELQDISAIVEGALGEDLMEKYPAITDMMAQNSTGSGNINVAYTYIPPTERVAYKLLSDREIIDLTLETSKEMFLTSYQSMGMENISLEPVTVTFLGEERVALSTSGTLLGSEYHILQVFDYSLGVYGVTITASSLGEDTTQDLLNVFYAVD